MQFEETLIKIMKLRPAFADTTAKECLGRLTSGLNNDRPIALKILKDAFLAHYDNLGIMEQQLTAIDLEYTNLTDEPEKSLAEKINTLIECGMTVQEACTFLGCEIVRK